MAKKRNRLLQKALNELSFEAPEYFKESKDLESYIKEQELLRTETLGTIATLEGNIRIIDNNINNLNLILKQIKVEELKELNPKAKITFL